LAGMNGDAYEVGRGGPYLFAIVIDPFIANYPDGAMRKPRLDDVVLNTRIIQSRPDVCMASLMDYPMEDIKGPASRYRAMEAHLLNHAKPYALFPTSYEGFMEWLEIGEIVNQGRPLKNTGMFLSAVAVISPLTISGMNCKILLECVRNGFAIIPTTCPMAGSTSPYTFAGTLVQGIAEAMAVLCAVQVMNPGNPFLFAFGASVTDMKTGKDLYYPADKAIWKMAAMNFAKRLGLPALAETGGATNSRYDMQGGAEGMLMVLSAMASGADVLAGAGSCLNANGVSAEYILTHYAFLDAAAHLKNGYPLSGLDASLNSIREQGCGGDFLTDDLTVAKLRDSEFFSSPIFDYSAEAGGGRPMIERAHDQALRINEGFVSPVPEKVADGLKRHFNSIYRKLGQI